MYGRPSSRLTLYIRGTTRVDMLDKELCSKDTILSILKENLAKAQQRMKLSTDWHRTKRTFEVGDWIFLRLQPYHQYTISFRTNMKLAPKFYRPFQILERIGTVAYQLDLPHQARIHPIFHVSCLKKKIGDTTTLQTHLPTTDQEGIVVVKPKSILDWQLVKRGNKAVMKLLVQWHEMPREEATWEFLRSFW